MSSAFRYLDSESPSAETNATYMQLLAGTALGLGLLLSLFNWASIFVSRPEKNVSPIPLLGGILLAVGFLGFELTRPYWWLAAIIDFGTLMAFLALPWFIYEMWAHSERNAKHVFASVVGDRTVEIKLFKNEDAGIKISFDPPRPYGDRGNRAVSCGYLGTWNQHNDQFRITGYAGGRQLTIQPSAAGYVLAEAGPAGPSIYSLDGLQLERRLASTDNRS